MWFLLASFEHNTVFGRFQLYKPCSHCDILSLLLNKQFSNFKLEKHRSILFVVLGRVEINENVADIVSLFLT